MLFQKKPICSAQINPSLIAPPKSEVQPNIRWLNNKNSHCYKRRLGCTDQLTLKNLDNLCRNKKLNLKINHKLWIGQKSPNLTSSKYISNNEFNKRNHGVHLFSHLMRFLNKLLLKDLKPWKQHVKDDWFHSNSSRMMPSFHKVSRNRKWT